MWPFKKKEVKEKEIDPSCPYESGSLGMGWGFMLGFNENNEIFKEKEDEGRLARPVANKRASMNIVN